MNRLVIFGYCVSRKDLYQGDKLAWLKHEWNWLLSHWIKLFFEAQRTCLNSFNYETQELSEAGAPAGSEVIFQNIIKNIIHAISNITSRDFHPRAVWIHSQHHVPNTQCQLEPLPYYLSVVSKCGEIHCFFHHWKSILISKYSASKGSLLRACIKQCKWAKQRENQNRRGWTRLNRSLTGNICDRKRNNETIQKYLKGNFKAKAFN